MTALIPAVRQQIMIRLLREYQMMLATNAEMFIHGDINFEEYAMQNYLTEMETATKILQAVVE